MEDAMMNSLVDIAKKRGIKNIVGYYYPTAKNGMVKEFYANYEYAITSVDEDGNTEWRINADDYMKRSPHMNIDIKVD